MLGGSKKDKRAGANESESETEREPDDKERERETEPATGCTVCRAHRQFVQGLSGGPTNSRAFTSFATNLDLCVL